MTISSRAIVGFLASALALVNCRDDRSRSTVNEFRRLNPCPLELAAGERCSQFFQIDHMQALVCGGRDEVSNLAWITIAEHKAKTRQDVRSCRGKPWVAAWNRLTQ